MKKLISILFVSVCFLSMNAVAGDIAHGKKKPEKDKKTSIYTWTWNNPSLTKGVNRAAYYVAKNNDAEEAVHCKIYDKEEKITVECWFCNCARLEKLIKKKIKKKEERSKKSSMNSKRHRKGKKTKSTVSPPEKP